MSIPQQVATPTPSGQARRLSNPLQPVAKRRRALVMVRIGGLVAITALGLVLTLGTVAVALVLVASNLSG